MAVFRTPPGGHIQGLLLLSQSRQQIVPHPRDIPLKPSIPRYNNAMAPLQAELPKLSQIFNQLNWLMGPFSPEMPRNVVFCVYGRSHGHWDMSQLCLFMLRSRKSVAAESKPLHPLQGSCRGSSNVLSAASCPCQCVCPPPLSPYRLPPPSCGHLPWSLHTLSPGTGSHQGFEASSTSPSFSLVDTQLSTGFCHQTGSACSLRRHLANPKHGFD